MTLNAVDLRVIAELSIDHSDKNRKEANDYAKISSSIFGLYLTLVLLQYRAY